MLRRRLGLSLTLSAAFALAGCPGTDHPPGTDGGPGNDSMVDSGPNPPHDGGPGRDGGMPMSRITICPGDSAPALASGVCEVTGSGPGLLIQADVLAPDEVFRGGQVFVDATGTIACVGCDCSTSAGAAAATHVTCPNGVLSPGLINAHEHLTYQGLPYHATAERYEHRHDWREGLHGHTRITSTGSATAERVQWAELRMAFGGATSINGSGNQAGLLRNLDRGTMEGLGHAAVHYETFPLDDSSGTEIASGCTGYSSSRLTSADIMTDTSFTPHLGEGVGAAARNEYLCQSTDTFDLIQPQTALIHGVGLLPIDMQGMATDNAMLIWSPRSNVTLYGDTAHVVEYDRMGVPIAMGTDWIYSGSMNMLRELQCADELNATYFDGHFSDEQLWRMATYNGALALAADDLLGAIVVGHIADLSIFDATTNVDHRAVIDATAADVALVLRSGVPLYGEDAVVAGMPTGGTTCDTIDVCGHARRACVMRELHVTLATLAASNAGAYPLFFCGAPDNEPSCRPERDATGTLPSPMVAGSNAYSGMTSAGDMDGDGIEDAMDNCPRVFNPVRPLDMGMQADSDMDAIGDSCDPCPLDANVTTCSTVDPNDRDHDMIPDATDNCPSTANMDQADTDGDGHGDACDPCPMAANPGSAACPTTIYSIQMGTTTVGAHVAIHGVVTAIGANGFFLQVPVGDPDYTVADFSGIYVYTSSAPTVVVGAAVSVNGTVAAYMNENQITAPTVTMTGTGVVPAPVAVTAAEIATGGTRAHALEGVLAVVSNAMVTDIMPAPGTADTAPTYEFVVGTALRVDDMLYRLTPFPALGESFTSITGIVAARNGNSRLLPRTVNDVEAGTPRLIGFGPALSYTRVGSTGAPTFAVPLTVQLTRAGSADVVVSLMSGDAALAVPATVTVPAGASSAPVLVSGVTQAASVTLTATLGTDTPLTANVRVLGTTEAPTSFTLSPAMATVMTGGTAIFTVTLDLPAPTGGQLISLAETTGGTLAASVTVPADATTAMFTFTAGAAMATGTLTASGLGSPQMASLMITTAPPGHLVINEVDYDQPSPPASDSMEFVELYNSSSSTISLAGLQLVLVNGGSTPISAYTTVDLSTAVDLPSHGYLVVGSTALLATITADREIAFVAATNAIQNGPNDGIAIYNMTTGTLVDAISYEGPLTMAPIGGHTFSLVEGTALAGAGDTGAGSICRIPNGTDTDDSASDWMTVAVPTPGAANM